MNRKSLDKKLSLWTKELVNGDKKFLLSRLSGLKSVFPFNEYEFRLMFLLDRKVISFEEYEKLRSNYIKKNPYLELYGLAPRTFGGIWAEGHLIDTNRRFKKASKKDPELRKLDSNFNGEYDLYLSIVKNRVIKIEVKASRADNTEIRRTQESTALYYKSKEPFWMNFQQIKLNTADVFVFIGVWVDRINYWVLTNNEIRKHPKISHQHRGGVEYQIGITNKNINEFNKFLVKPGRLVNMILKKMKVK